MGPSLSCQSTGEFLQSESGDGNILGVFDSIFEGNSLGEEVGSALTCIVGVRLGAVL